MHISKIKQLTFLTSAIFMASTSVMAQDLFSADGDSYPEDSYSGSSASINENAPPAYTYQPAPAPAPAPEPAPVKAAPEAVKSAVRGNAHENTLSGDKNMGFHLAWPHLMNNKQLFYIQPNTERGVVSMGMGDNTFFLGASGASIPGQLTVGMVLGEGMGLSLNIARDWDYESQDIVGATSTSTNTTGSGDLLGLNFSMPMGSNAFRAYFNWLTSPEQVSSNSVSNSEYALSLGGEFSNFPSQDGLAWALGLRATRNSHQTKISTAAGTNIDLDPMSNFEIAVNGDFDKKIMVATNARVIFGLYNDLNLTLWDNIDNAREGGLSLDIYSAPQVLAEFDATESWQFFGSFTQRFALARMNTVDNVTAPNNTKVSSDFGFRQYTTGTTASAGARFIYGRLSLEAALSDHLFVDGPAAVFTGGDFLGTFSAQLTF